MLYKLSSKTNIAKTKNPCHLDMAKKAGGQHLTVSFSSKSASPAITVSVCRLDQEVYGPVLTLDTESLL